MQDLVRLTRKIAELCASDEDDPEHGWRIQLAYMEITVSGRTHEHYRNEAEAWKGAQRLWKVVLDHGFELSGGSRSELGVVQGQGPDNTWNATIHMFLYPIVP
jgi:hypothetical protein